MSKEAFDINLEIATTLMTDNYSMDAFALERSQHPGIRLLYSMNDSDFLPENKDILLTGLIQTLRTTNVRSLEDKYKPEYSEIPLTAEAKDYMRKVASLTDDTWALGKIVAKAALSISEGKDYEEVKGEVDAMHRSFTDTLMTQVRKDQQRNPLYIEIDGETHEILAGGGERTLGELEASIREIAPRLTAEQMNYIIQSYEQSIAGTGAIQLAEDNVGGMQGGYSIAATAVSTNILISDDNVLVNIDRRSKVSYNDGENDPVPAGTIVTTLQNDITNLRGDEAKLPGLASAKIVPILNITYVGDQEFLKVPSYATTGREAQKHLGDYCARELAKSGLFGGIATPEGIEQLGEFIKSYPPELRDEMIASIQSVPGYSHEYTNSLIRYFGLETREIDKVIELTIAKEDRFDIVADLVVERLKNRIYQTGGMEYGEIAELVRDSVKSKLISSSDADRLTRNVGAGLGMDTEEINMLHAIALVKEAKEKSEVTKEMLVARLSYLERVEQPEKLIEDAARGENVGRFVPRSLAGFFRRSPSSPSKMVWSPRAESSTPVSVAISPSPASTPVTMDPEPTAVAAAAAVREVIPKPQRVVARKPSFVERYAPERAKSPRSFVEQVSGVPSAPGGPERKA